MVKIELFSARVCPFAHRSRLALMEKGVPFEIVEIDLHHKPDWYRDVTPAEAVPALRQGDFVLRESLVINEFVNDLVAEPPLLPDNPRQRAEARLRIAIFDGDVRPLFYRLLRAQQTDERVTAGRRMLEALAELDEDLQRRRGPFWFGERVGLTDIACYPWFERWPVLEHYRGLKIPDDLEALQQWIAAMRGHEVVQQGAQPAEFYIREYADYANNSARNED